MSQQKTDGLIHGLRRLAVEEADALTDTQLLRRFAADRDEVAFTVIIHRYGRLVHGVCRNVLRNDHDAEDAAQGTFLVLARRAGAIREGQAVGGWLYRVAYRVATKARTAAERRRRREARAARPDQAKAVADLAWRDLQAMLDEELNRLPERLRTPFVLCILAGKSKSEAAADLGWKEGTVSSRLAKARERIRGRLARRGVALSAILSGLAVADRGVAVVIPGDFVAAARAFADGQAVASTAADLARAFLRSAAVARIQIMASLAALVGLGGVIAVAAMRTPTPEAPPDPPPAAPEPVSVITPVPALVPELEPKDLTPTMLATGSVVGPNGKTVPGARVGVMATRVPRPGEVVAWGQMPTPFLGAGVVPDSGSFRLTVPQTTLDYARFTGYAHAPGYALTSWQLGDLSIRFREQAFPRPFVLVPAKPVRGRVVDADGKPVAGLTLHVLGMWRRHPSAGIGYLATEPPVLIPGWPTNVVTDADGLFTIEDQLDDTVISIQVRDERFANDWIKFTARPDTTPTFRLEPPRVLTGRVTAADTGAPIADAVVLVETPHTPAKPPGHLTVRTDKEGRYRARPFVGTEHTVKVFPPAGAPYLAVEETVAWPAGAATHSADVTVPRGVLVRGTVVEAAAGKPVAGAGIGYAWDHEDNKTPTDRLVRGRPWDANLVASAVDGSFALVVPPGPGHLVVKAAESDYVPREVSGGELAGRGKAGPAYFVHALVPLNVAPEAAPAALTVRLERGLPLTGNVVLPDGNPSRTAMVVSPTFLPRGTELTGHALFIPYSRFTIPGCRPNEPVPLWFIDPPKNAGGRFRVPLKANLEPTVHLQPLVAARVRCVDQLGLPLALDPEHPDCTLHLEIRAGVEPSESWMDRSRPPALYVNTESIYGAGFWPKAKDGVLHLAYLIPGATYKLRVHSPSGTAQTKTFRAPQTGELDLGTMRFEQRVKK
jgi:RNA polymerase sigma factor (sigma-70 family)